MGYNKVRQYESEQNTGYVHAKIGSQALPIGAPPTALARSRLITGVQVPTVEQRRG